MPDEPFDSPSAERFHGFWPVLLVGVSFLLVLGWEIQVAVTTRQNTERLREQQLHVVDQAKQVQTSLEKIVRGLIELSKTDDAAKEIVTKFGVKITNPPGPNESPTP